MINSENYINYYKPEKFYNTNNVAYAEYKEAFNYALKAFQESEDIKDKIKKYYNNEQLASMLILANAQNLFIAILKICNAGMADVAGILQRSLFEDYIQLKFIKKNMHGSLFVNYTWISLKREMDRAEKKTSDKKNLESDEYLTRKALIDQQYDKYKHDYIKKIRKWNNVKSWFKPRLVIRNKWSNKSLWKMAKNIGERQSYDTIMPYHSKFVHCDPHGLFNFLQGKEEDLVVDNSESLRGIDLILKVAPEIYCRLVIEVALCFNIDVSEFFKKYIA